MLASTRARFTLSGAPSSRSAPAAPDPAIGRSSTFAAGLSPSFSKAAGCQQRDVMAGGAIDLDEIALPEIPDPPGKGAAFEVAAAKTKGVKFGRKLKLALHQQRQARERLAAGETQRSVARSYVSQSTISQLIV
jgi:hypothetical protein